MILDEIIYQRIRENHERMKKEGRLSSEAQSKMSDDLRYLRFHLIKLLQDTPQENNKESYISLFEEIAQELGITPYELMATLDDINGRPHRYWRIGTNRGQDGRGESVWDHLRDGNYVAIGWTELDDLSDITHDEAGKEEIRDRLDDAGYDPTEGNVFPPFKFATEIQKGDLVLASKSLTVLGLGRVIGSYYYKNNDNCPWPHRIPVKWISLKEWTLPRGNTLQPAVYEIKNVTNLIEIERRICNAPPTYPLKSHSKIISRIKSILGRKGQVILYGPPGTGKTYWAERAAFELAAQSNFQIRFDQLSDDQRSLITGDGESFGAVRTCCFHPAYGYEDFIEGYRPEQADGQMIFSLRDGVFKRLCKDALDEPETSFYLIIDEINRGDIPRIFGELMTIIEKDKRGKSITLPTSREQFKVPSNVSIIGTMNTADRSIALLDAALRRRFGFIELMPDQSVLGDATVSGINLGRWLEALNLRICEHVGKDARNLQIGHSYLLKDDGTPIADFSEFARALHEEIIPLLEEYCYEDYNTLEKILGTGIVDANDQKIRHELFKFPDHEGLVNVIDLTSMDISSEWK
ncbi:MAG TPA: AAA family ATPase [Methanothrix sp.]|nr:AAA family ATPase [Methanothrix sp.]HPJ84421.1 AAA family ATPase [Methanothrix sp.]